MKISIIGDVHGKTNAYTQILRRLGPDAVSIQVGDMGLGFKGVGLPPPGTAMPAGDHTFFRGNHDDPQKCRRHPSYRGDWGYDSATGIFHVAGRGASTETTASKASVGGRMRNYRTARSNKSSTRTLKLSRGLC